MVSEYIRCFIQDINCICCVSITGMCSELDDLMEKRLNVILRVIRGVSAIILAAIVIVTCCYLTR